MSARTAFTFWDPEHPNLDEQAGMILLWDRSWRARGWKTRILCLRDLKKHPSFGKVSYVLTAVSFAVEKDGFFSHPGLINFSYPVEWDGPPADDALVRFKSEAEMLNCGRPIC